MVLVNKVLAAGRAKPGQAEVVRRGALYATATLSLGLEIVARGDLERAQQALRIDRARPAVPRRLHGDAQAREARDRARAALGHRRARPRSELVAALCSPRPLFSRAADEPPMPGMRPFESQADLRRAGEILTGLTIRIALVEGLGVDVVAMGQAPEPRPELDDHIRTALARAVVGGELRGEALSQAELHDAARRRRSPAASSPTTRARARVTPRSARASAPRSSPASGPILAQLVDGWLDDLERILGDVKDAEIDPRFVEGVLVEVSRS